MKTITQWLQTLPEPYRSQALNQPEALRFREYPHSQECDSLNEAINNAFLWKGTEQGQDYWLDIAERAETDEFDRLGIDCTIPEDET
jgi:hypothetical protein